MNLVSLWLSLGERLIPVLLDLLNRSRAVFLLLLAAVLLRFLFYWGPKRVRCLMWALKHDERFGIWGGLSERERRHFKKTVSAKKS